MTDGKTVEILAQELRRAMDESRDAAINADAEATGFVLAELLVSRLEARGIKIAPEKELMDAPVGMNLMHGDAARRSFDALTKWLNKDSNRFVSVSRTDEPGIRIAIGGLATNIRFFSGVDMQDACAQAAQTIWFEEDLS